MSIEKSYNSWATQYDTNENKTRDLDKEITIEILSKYNFDTVIELGCGTGKNTLWLSQKAKQVVGLDFSQEMLNKAKAKITDSSVSFVKTDITKEWKIEKDFANLITCNLILEHIESLNSIFDQAYHKLQSNGLFFISELHPSKQYIGSKARFKTDKGTVVLETYTHHVSEYIDVAILNNFQLLELKEHFDKSPENEIPRLISFVFKKK